MTSKTKNIIVLVGTLALVGVFAMFGTDKFINPDKWAGKFEAWGVPLWFVTVSGVIELAGAIGLLIPVLRSLAGLGLGMFMIGAVATHVIHAEIGMIFVAGTIMVGSASIGWYRLSETKTFLKEKMG